MELSQFSHANFISDSVCHFSFLSHKQFLSFFGVMLKVIFYKNILNNESVTFSSGNFDHSGGLVIKFCKSLSLRTELILKFGN